MGGRRLAGAVAVLVVSTMGAIGVHAAENLDGFWMDSDGEVILEVGPCGDRRCAKVAWLRKPNGPDGLPLRDYRNSDPNLRSRPVCGLEVVTGFKRQPDGTWGDGTVYVSDLGASFSGYAEVLSPTSVKVTGYIILPIFGDSEVWTRVSAPFEHCEGRSAKAGGPQRAAKTITAPAARAGLRSGAATTAPRTDQAGN